MLMRILRTYLRPYKGPIAIIIVMQAIQALAGLYLPTLNADIINDGVSKGDVGYIWGTGGIMLAVTLVQVIASVVSVFFSARTAMSLGRDVRSDQFAKVQTFSSREMAKFGAPSLITRATNDVQQVQMLVMMSFAFIVQAPITMVGGVIMALQEDVPLSGVILISVPALALIVLLVVLKMRPLFKLVQKRIDAINRVLREQIEGIRVIRAFVRDGYEHDRFGQTNKSLTDVQLSVGKWMSLMFPLVMLVMNLSSLLVIWWGGYRISDGTMEVGSLTAFISYLMQILMSVMMASMMFMMVPRAEVCSERIVQVLDTNSTVVPPRDPVFAFTAPGTLELRDATFRYPGAEFPVLRDITFSAAPGQTTAIIGSTGAGKTTLLNLIPRLFDATSGQVFVGGVDVKRLDEQALWGAIGMVPQKPYLFTGTIRSNLLYGKEDASDEEIWHALEVAQAKEFVSAYDDGLDHEIAQGGTNVSGGQRQRLAIARALIRKPDIYLFDDSFSALDFATDARLRAALAPETEHATVVIVAQRVGTIKDADQIIVLDDGAIVGKGRHDDLMETCETYREIVLSQMSLEEATA